MSCDCNNSNEFPCREELPYPIVSAESVPSLISNLAYALYGTVTKSVVNGSIIWTTPCDPNLSAQITGLPRNPGEGLLCYFLRCFNLIVADSFLVQPGSIAPSQLTTGHPAWDASGNLTIAGNLALTGTANIANITGNAATATLAAASTNLQGGSAGSLPYQSAVNTTSFLSPGASGYVLASGGAGAPSWKPTAIAATPYTVAVRDGSGNLTAGTFLGNASTATSLAATRTISLTGAVTGSAIDNSGNISIPTSLSFNGTKIVAIFNPTLANLTGGALTGSAGVATVGFSAPHGRSVGDFVNLFSQSGLVPSNCVGQFIITAVTNLTLSFAITGSVTGTITGVTVYPFASIYNPNNVIIGQYSPTGVGSVGRYNVVSSLITTTSAFCGSAGGAGTVGGSMSVFTAPSPGLCVVEAVNGAGTPTDYQYTCVMFF